MIVLGIETSCDETSAAVVVDGALKSNIISSQFVHVKYGGVVPELASRAHQQLIVPVVEEALRTAGVEKSQLGGIAVTYGPGLAGALLVGLNFAKALAYALKVPYVGVHHMEAHIFANFIEQPVPQFPFLCLIVSGGHTQLVLVRDFFDRELIGETLDDAAGEAYDKVAKMLGLGFPGGPAVDKLAAGGNAAFVEFPRSFLNGKEFDFSFSGIKTSVLYWLRDYQRSNPGVSFAQQPGLLCDLCASFQAAVVDVLVEKTFRAASQLGVRELAIAGGVSANSELRKRMNALAGERGYRLTIPKAEYCTDNGAMIALTGYLRLKSGVSSDNELNAVPNLAL
ncbi:MAG TPA: tRNA (adenosine(37)-N6)-threonylcarbamoyltransferase complex transferase subunit TsaD [Bacteroidota bacterium]|jgi:N6-L-threonylcarbamoyladenine synthase|nr:tRNA (adenosine(37)-N6)-threonylcarbamoyltransferase complex transferase subunit TsaD [Bacteroidota bacterium]